MLTRYVTPWRKSVPLVVMSKLLTPETATHTRLGTQPLLSLKVTEKVKRVAVVPDAGLAVPLLREGVCAPAHVAPPAAVVASRLTRIARDSARRRTIATALLSSVGSACNVRASRCGDHAPEVRPGTGEAA